MAGAVFLGAVIPFGLLILAVEGRHGWARRRWLNRVEQGLIAAVVGCSLGSLAVCFGAVNGNSPITGGSAVFVYAASAALYLSSALFLLTSMEANAKLAHRDKPDRAG